MKNPFAIRENPLRPVPREAYGWRIHVLAISAAFASAMFGYDQAFIGGTLSLPSFQKAFGVKAGSAAATALSANVTSVFQAGCFFGSIIGYAASEKFGRRPQLIGSGFLFLVGAIIQVVSKSRISMIYAGRVLTGLSVGSSSLCVPIYIAESAPVPIRGRLVGIFEIGLQIASVIGFWINYGVQKNMAPTNSQWQIPFAIQLVPAGCLVISMLFMPESPRWLVKQGRVEEAEKSLSWSRNLPRDHDFISSEIEEMKTSIEIEEMEAGGSGTRAWLQMWREIKAPGIRNRVLLAILLKVLQNLTGTQAINYYSPTIFKSIGFRGTSNSLLATGVFGLVKMVATVLCMFAAVDSIGRRPLLLWGSIGSAIPMYYLGGYGKLSGSFGKTTTAASPDAGAYVSIVMVYIFAVMFAISWNGIPWIFASEIFPTKMRALGMMLAMSATWTVQFAIVYSTPYMIKGIQYGIFFFFAACITISYFLVWAFIPETKGISMEDMEYLFNGSILAVKARKDAMILIQESDGRRIVSEKPVTEMKEDVVV